MLRDTDQIVVGVVGKVFWMAVGVRNSCYPIIVSICGAPNCVGYRFYSKHWIIRIGCVEIGVCCWRCFCYPITKVWERFLTQKTEVVVLIILRGRIAYGRRRWC